MRIKTRMGLSWDERLKVWLMYWKNKKSGVVHAHAFELGRLVEAMEAYHVLERGIACNVCHRR